jgi:hypothetical protein
MPRGCFALLLVALLTVGCTTTAATATPSVEDVATPAPVPTIDQQGLVAGRLTCGNGDTFPAAALEGPGGAERGNDAPAAGLRAVIAEPGDPHVPDTGWHLVSLTATHAQYVARGQGDSGWTVVVLERGPSGWTMDGAGDCQLSVVVGAGIGLASWWVDPAAGAPGPAAHDINVLVQERACASGRAPVGRIAPPLVSYGRNAIVAVFGVIPLPGGQDCPGAPPAPFTLRLEEPLGNRALLDGGVVPPRDATKPPD